MSEEVTMDTMLEEVGFGIQTVKGFNFHAKKRTETQLVDRLASTGHSTEREWHEMMNEQQRQGKSDGEVV
jgi:hypothetical protein